MAENDSTQEKTEEPSPKRLEDAREEGQVLTSKEMFTFTSFLLGTVILALSAPLMQAGVSDWARGFAFGPTPDLDSAISDKLSAANRLILITGLGIGVPMVAVVILTQAAMGGVNFAPKALGFKVNKIDPIQGIARMFSMKSLVELGKSILKLAFLTAAAWIALAGMMAELAQLGAMELGAALSVFGKAVLRVFVALTIALGLIGAVDLLWQMHDLGRKLRMSRQDLKEEAKEQEGAPELKAQIRRRQYEAAARAKERKALGDVPRATAIVTNPTHFAVALRYIPGEDDAPIIVAMGRDLIAAEIRKRGNRARITQVSAPSLARALYFTGQIGQNIAPDLYTAVATLLAHIWRIENGAYEDAPEFDLPETLKFNEFGRTTSDKNGGAS